MSRFRQYLRSVSALCLALLVYAAIPHSHAGHLEPAAGSSERAERVAPNAADERVAPASGVVAVLLADEAHETHSSSAALQAEPCTLCRNIAERGIDSAPATPQRVAVIERSACPSAPAAKRPALLLAARHPARAPPRA